MVFLCKGAALFRRHHCIVAFLVPVLLAFVFCAVLIGQSETSFAIVVDAPFTDTDIKSLIDPHLQKPVPIPDQGVVSSVASVNVTQIVCDKFRLGKAWLLTTNGPELWINISDVRIECHAHYSVSVVASTPMVEGGVTVLAERSGLSGLVLVERADNDLRISLLNCEANFLFTEADFSGGISASILQMLSPKVKQYLTDTLNGMACTAVHKVIEQTFSPANRPKSSQIVHLLTESQVLSIWGSIKELLRVDERLLGTLLLLLSGVWPLVKQFLLLFLWTVPLGDRCVRAVLTVVDLVGKWSMVDILFVGLLMTVLKVDIRFVVHATLYVEPHRGVYIYTGAILSSLALAAWIRHLSYAPPRKPERAPQPSILDVTMLTTVDELFADEEVLLETLQDTDAFLPAGAEGDQPASEPPRRRNVIFGLIVLEAVLTTLGLLLPICRLSRVIHVEGSGGQQFFRDVQDHQYSVFDLAMVMHELKGDPVLLALQLVFVCFVPLLKWWVTVGLWITVYVRQRLAVGRDKREWSASSPALWRAVEALQAWDMREVFLATLIILCVRVSTWIGNFSQGYAVISMTPLAMPGFWCCVLAVLLDYGLLVVQPWR
eukprot:EG_transcript_5304